MEFRQNCSCSTNWLSWPQLAAHAWLAAHTQLRGLQGGANAGHTVYDEHGTKYALHLIPSGILNRQAQCIVGNGVVVHLPTLFEEMDRLEQQGISFEGRFLVSDRCVLPLRAPAMFRV